MKPYLAKLVTFFVALTMSSACLAWGMQGHRVTGLIAEKFLTQKTKDRVQEILGGMSLADAATWMDRERPTLLQFDSTTPLWHFDDVPVCGKAVLDDYCPDGNCASEKTKLYLKVLADSDSTPEELADAVKFIIHMVGDLHQPLHSSDNKDRGGNLVMVNFNDARVKLHHAWDTELVTKVQGDRSEDDFANDLYAAYTAKKQPATPGDVEQWVTESHKLAVKYSYGELTGFACKKNLSGTQALTDTYIKDAVTVIEAQLAKAGARIAYLLNSTLDN